MQRHFTVTVYVMNADSQFLFIRHKKLQKWLPPGGHIEANEVPDEAALREVKEETGLDVALVGETLPRRTDCVRPFAIQRNVTVEGEHEHLDLIYLARPTSRQELVQNFEETDGIAWYNIDEILSPEFDTFPEEKQWCEKFFDIGPAMRSSFFLETERLILRELTMEDLEDLHAIFSDSESMEYYQKPFTLNESKHWIEWNLKSYADYGFGLWGVVLKDTGQFIGDCGITMQNIDGCMEPEIGYHINKKYLNNGYATEAAQVCKNYAFKVLGFKKIYSYMKHANTASRRVAEKNGMKLIKEIEDPTNGITAIYAINSYCIQPISEEHRAAVNKVLQDEWFCPPSVSRGRALDTTILPGFVSISESSGDIDGVVTYNIENAECEIVTLNSFDENKGIGTALVNAVLAAAKEDHCRRLWLITTNDDTNAIRFYQKKGFELAAAHINAVENVSRKMKPSIPLLGMDNIPIKHELEFEICLN